MPQQKPLSEQDVLRPDAVPAEDWVPGTPFITDLDFQESGDKRGAIYMAIGAASACWDNLVGAGTFESTRAKQIGDDLVRFLDTDGGMSAGDAAWLEVLIQNAIPRNPHTDNWEGRGREHAEEILNRAKLGGPSDTDKRAMGLIDWLKEARSNGANVVPIDNVLQHLGEVAP